jgi:multidrug efflux system membrane fusion protein
MRLRQMIADRPWILALAVALAVVLWMLSGSLSRKLSDAPAVAESATPPTEQLTRVQVRIQVAQPVTRFIGVYGRTAPARSVELNAETEGRVHAIAAQRGQRVRKGDVILRLDLRDRQARLAQANAQVNQHLTAYEAQLELQGQGYVSETQIAETMAKLEAARAELTRAELDLDYMVIRAPFDGVLKDRDVEVGDFVRSGDAVGTFVDNTRIIVTGSLAEQDARFIAVDDTADATLVTGQNVRGRIRYIDPVADESTRTFTIELEVPNPDGTLPAGVTAEMQVPADEALAQKISPSLLTLDDAGNIGVKTIDAYNRVVFHPVEIAQSTADGVWVAGLPETANVIVLGQGYVGVGQEVDPVFTDSDTALAAEKPQ